MEGRSLSDLFRGRPADQVAAFQQQMKSLMDAEGLPYGSRTMTWNSRLAQELAAWADTRENGDRLHGLLYRAYFVDNLNLADVDTLVDLAQRAGLDPLEARDVLVRWTFSGDVDNDWRHAAELGITGVPSFVSQGLCVVGCQPYEVLLRFVNHLRKLRDDTGPANG